MKEPNAVYIFVAKLFAKLLFNKRSRYLGRPQQNRDGTGRIYGKDGRAIISRDTPIYTSEHLAALYGESWRKLVMARPYLFCERLGRFAQI